MAPADNPEIVIAVVMDEPKTGARDGGMVAAPVFREVAQQILQEMKIVPDAPFKQDALTAQDVPEMPAKQTDLKTKKVDDGSSAKTLPPAKDKEKLKEPVKPPKKPAPDGAKVTASLRGWERPRGREQISKNKLET